MIAGMRLTAVAAFAVVSVLATFAGGCAHSLESAREDRVVVAVDHGGADIDAHRDLQWITAADLRHQAGHRGDERGIHHARR